ncbi:FAD-dependent monooxygenase [Thalassomonas actiniarum]|uniref:FAD-dependent monooxygenase n=1 Tax=Thalassomonas actiniarum TaxID=485447 RepID=A0AAE9YWD1_9GAMM|nr:FAD-dependent monooxygenase [Thalassomonas actiniarum]WDE02406.1 FAD-dependent monooxygenase [Thalassomonas actiniarum]
MNSNNRIAIVGAGVAGLSLAILAKKQGYQVSLYERDCKVSSIGAGVTLWPNAVFILQQMGLEKEIKRLGGVPSYMHQFDHYGIQQGELDIEEVNTLSGFPSVTILRRDLMNILAKELESLGVEILFNCSVTAENIEKLKQEFSLVVGADGRMNSIVRQTLYPEKVQPCYQGFINIIGISQLEEKVLDNVIHDFRGPGERFGIVPIKAGLCFWAGGWSTHLYKERPLSAWYDEMHQRFMNWPEPVQNVLKSYEKESLNRIFVHDIDPLPYWHQNNVLIIGDAAHAPLPTSGQGACQALEDAWHLARNLVKKDELENILAGFYQQRIVKTSAAQTAGRQLAQSIFGDYSEPQLSVSGISAKQLSEFWMQGLEMKST